MKPLEVKTPELTLLMFLGGQNVLIAEDVKLVDSKIHFAVQRPEHDWVQLRVADSDEDDPPGAFRAHAIVGFYRAEPPRADA